MKKKLIAMIPARMGSKRIPKKNIRYLGDKPLIMYPIELTKQANGLDSIWINTESRELGTIAEKAGIQFHHRPGELSGDHATNREFTYEFLMKHDCDYVIMVNPTSPLLRSETLEAFLEFVENNDYDTILSVVSYQSESFFQGTEINFPLSEKINSQHLEPVNVTAWALTAWKRSTFIKLQRKGENPVFGGRLGFFSIPKDECCDLDTPEDWAIAEGALMSKNPKYKYEEKYLDVR